MSKRRDPIMAPAMKAAMKWGSGELPTWRGVAYHLGVKQSTAKRILTQLRELRGVDSGLRSNPNRRRAVRATDYKAPAMRMGGPEATI